MADTQLLLQQSFPYLLVFLMCSFIVGTLQCSQMALNSFKYPFVLRYINTVEQILLVVTIPIWRWCKVYGKSKTNTNENYNDSAINYKLHKNVAIQNKQSQLKTNTCIIKQDVEYNDKYYQWFIFYTFCGSLSTSSAGMILNLGISHMTVPTTTALSSFRTVFTLIFSVTFLSFPLKLWSICAVLVSCLGVLLYVMEINHNYNNDGSHHDTIYGISCSLTAQLLFAINDIICKKAANYCYDKNRITMGNILYTVYTSLIALPLFIWVLWTPKNIFQANDLSLDNNTCFWIFMTGVCLMGIHVSGYVTITLKSPIFIAMGFLFATPMSFIVDMIWHHYKPSYLCILGGMLLLLGFLMLEIIRPSQILCPFCDKKLINKGKHETDVDSDWYASDIEESNDFARKCKLSDSLEHEYGYKYKNNSINTNNMNSNNSNKNNSGNSSDDIVEPMLSALLQSGATYTSTLPSDIADISFDANGNVDTSD